MTRLATIALALAGGLWPGMGAPAQDAGAEPVDVAVFDFELVDTSLEGSMLGVQEAETRRLDALGEALRAAYAEAEGYRVVDLAPVREEAARRSLRNCGGCARGLARRSAPRWP